MGTPRKSHQAGKWVTFKQKLQEEFSQVGRRDIAHSNTQRQTLQSGGSQVPVKDLMKAKGPASKNTHAQ